MEDLYKVLDIKYTATQKDIKKAFREKSKYHHPDVGGDGDYFKQLSYAYEILSDESKRSDFDKKFFSKKTSNVYSWEERFGTESKNNVDYHKYDISYNLILTLNEVFFGTSKNIKVDRKLFNGVVSNCSNCNGNGFINTSQSFLGENINIKTTCKVCGGVGTFISSEKYKNVSTEVSISIERGFPIGQYKTIKNYGHENPYLKTLGNLIVYINIEEEPNWKVDNIDLYYYTHADILKFINGGKIKVPHFEKSYNVDLPPNTQTNAYEKVLKLNKLGLHRNGFNGNLYIKVKLKLPDKINEDERKLLEELCNMENFKDVY